MLTGFARLFYQPYGARLAADGFRYFGKITGVALLATLVCKTAMPVVDAIALASRVSALIGVAIMAVAAAILPYLCCFGLVTPRKVAVAMESDAK